MAKIGLLYLQQGVWDGEQLIPNEWARDSLTPHAYPKNAVDILNADQSKNEETSTRNWVAQRFFRPFADGYGYQWWLDREGGYSALGTSGQYITVAPGENLIFVATSKSAGMSQFAPASLLWTSQDTFSIKVEIIGYSTFDRWEFRFSGDEIHLTEHRISGKFMYSGKAKSSSQ